MSIYIYFARPVFVRELDNRAHCPVGNFRWHIFAMVSGLASCAVDTTQITARRQIKSDLPERPTRYDVEHDCRYCITFLQDPVHWVADDGMIVLIDKAPRFRCLNLRNRS